MLYVILTKNIEMDLGPKHYSLKSGDLVFVDTREMIAFHQGQDVCFDIFRDEYSTIQ